MVSSEADALELSEPWSEMSTTLIATGVVAAQ